MGGDSETSKRRPCAEVLGIMLVRSTSSFARSNGDCASLLPGRDGLQDAVCDTEQRCVPAGQARQDNDGGCVCGPTPARTGSVPMCALLPLAVFFLRRRSRNATLRIG